MSPILYAYVAAFIIALTSLSGIFVSGKIFRNIIKNNLVFLVTFALGIFVITTFMLGKETFEHNSLIKGIISIISGVVIVHLLSKLIPDAHHHHEPDTSHIHSKIDARRMLMGDAIHNIGDGLLLVPAFLANTYLGITTTAGILIHELVQEISEYFILKEAGYNTKDALIRNGLTSTTIFIGIILATLLVEIHTIKELLLGISTGGFLYIIIRDLIPHTYKSIKEKGHKSKHVFIFILGVILMTTLQIALPHSDEITETEHTASLHHDE